MAELTEEHREAPKIDTFE
jgi:peptide subunit release factor 1 (eRF1)